MENGIFHFQKLKVLVCIPWMYLWNELLNRIKQVKIFKNVIRSLKHFLKRKYHLDLNKVFILFDVIVNTSLSDISNFSIFTVFLNN